MKRLFSTDRNNWAALTTRLTLGIVVFPHGAQKLLGWFGGNGYEATMEVLSNRMHLPWIIAFLVIIIEFVGAIALILGVATRFFAIAMFIHFIGIILKGHIDNGFFMNWNMLPDTPEGFEFHLLIIGLNIVLLITGGGKWSLDAAISRRHNLSAT